MFHVGQLVVCIDDEWGDLEPDEVGPKKGRVLTIRRINFNENYSWLQFEEIINPINPDYGGDGEADFSCYHFRPVQNNRIAVFRQLLVNPPKELVE